MKEKSKVVKMEETAKKDEKLTYEQLEQVASNLNDKCRQLYKQLQDAQAVIAEFNEIGMLLAILDKSEHFEIPFVERCAKKVQDIITKALDASEKQEEEKES